ncbi:MAG: hypothetical protein JST91_10395 [Actinobacteria bacterium]|nr:hypothetical protein [Actinomycetota bacterium]
MRTHVGVGAAALIVVGFATGCVQTTPGTVAMTTEPGPPINAPTTTPPTSSPGFQIPDIQIPGLPLPTRDTPLPSVPAPANSQTMTCSEYLKLDDATRQAVVNAILAEQSSPLESMGDLAMTVTDTACGFFPDFTVSRVLSSGG